jgi:mannose-6-phosphate isomerase-like protein (cupin superfamily)
MDSTTRYEDGLGGSITILEPGDATTPMRFRMVLPKGFGPPAPECHPSQREDFHILRGTLRLGKVAGKVVRLGPGEHFTLEAGQFHLPANGGDDELEFEATLTPGLDSAQMFAELYTATRENRGLSQFARVAMVFRKYPGTISFPLPVRTVMSVVAGLCRTFGMRPTEVRALERSAA